MNVARAVQTKKGLKVYDLYGKHIKTVPKKYENILQHVEISIEKKRLTRRDRFNLEAYKFTQSLKVKQRPVWIRLQDDNATPIAARMTNSIKHGFVSQLKYSNGFYVICPETLYRLCDVIEPMACINY